MSTTTLDPLRGRPLTRRDREVLVLLGQGCSMAQIAWILNIRPSSVRSRTRQARRKLDATTNEEAVAAFGSRQPPEHQP